MPQTCFPLDFFFELLVRILVNITLKDIFDALYSEKIETCLDFNGIEKFERSSMLNGD